MDLKKSAVASGSPVPSRMPLVENRDTFTTLLSLCNTSTRLSLGQISGGMKRSVVAVIRKDSVAPMGKLGVALSGTLPLVACDSCEVPGIVKAASDSQFVACASQCCALLFAKCGDYWLVAVHCDDRPVAVVGWKQPAADCKQRPIQWPIAEKPKATVSVVWETNVKSQVYSFANSHESIAVGTYNGCMLLLNARTGAVVTDALKGMCVAFLDKDRVVGVVQNDETYKYELYEFTANFLTNEVTMKAGIIESVKASTDGKRLYVVDCYSNEVLERFTAHWLRIARIPLSGEPLGQCDIAANGLFAQAIENIEDDSYHIEVIETNTRCVTQTIRTKHSARINQVTFSPDSSRIVSVSRDKSVQLFDAITGQMIGEPRVAQSNDVTAVCFLSDALFVTVSMDKSLVIWHCDSQAAIARIEDAHDYGVCSVLRLSTDSFVSGDYQGSVKKWKLECK